MNADQRRSIAHALAHLEHNGIDRGEDGGWYAGNKQRFINRHIKAKLLLKTLLALSISSAERRAIARAVREKHVKFVGGIPDCSGEDMMPVEGDR